MEEIDAGNARVSFPEDALFKLDGGAMFGVVPKPLWSRKIQADDRNRIPLIARPMLVRTDDRIILVDTGIGDKWSDKERDIYGIEPVNGGLPAALEHRNIQRTDVTDVVLTHLHFDHAGGTTYYDESDDLQLTFPNATHHVQKDNLEWARNPTERDKASYREIDFAPLIGDDRLHLLDGDTELFPTVETIRVDGHTEGLQMVRVNGSSETVLYPTDLIPTAAHLELPYVMGYDLWPLTTLEQKKKVLPSVVENETRIAFEHDRKHTVHTLKKEDDTYVLKDRII